MSYNGVKCHDALVKNIKPKLSFIISPYAIEVKLSANDEINKVLNKYGEHIDRGIRLAELLKRPNITYDVFREIDSATKELNLGEDITGEVEVLIKYDGYIARQEQQVESTEKLEKYKIPVDIDYSQIKHISTETTEKLEKIRPATLGQAGRIDGVTPADIGLLQVHLKKLRGKVQDEK